MPGFFVLSGLSKNLCIVKLRFIVDICLPHCKVKKSKSYIIIVYALIASLLVSQLAVNLFHDEHDFHESLSKKTESLQKHSEHCKICSIDVLINLELVQPIDIDNRIQLIAINAPSQVVANFAFVALSKGRAPPAQR